MNQRYNINEEVPIMSSQQNQDYLKRLRELSGIVSAANRAEQLRAQAALASNQDQYKTPPSSSTEMTVTAPSYQSKVNAEIFKAIELLGRKLERSQNEQDRLLNRLHDLESLASFDETTGQYFLPVASPQQLLPPPNAAAPRWPIALSGFSVFLALCALIAVMRLEPSLTPEQLAQIQTQAKFSALEKEDAWQSLTVQNQGENAAEAQALTSSLLPNNETASSSQESFPPLDDTEATLPPLALPEDMVTSDVTTALTQTIDDKAQSDVSSAIPETETTPKTSDDKNDERAQTKPTKVTGLEPDSALTGDLKNLETRAFQGVPEAQHDLATLYASGKAVTQNFRRAAFWFARSSDQGIANAAYNLGVMYHQGLGMKVNLSQAVAWYKKAAERGHPEALYNLGISYVQGVGVKAQPERGLQYLKRAAELGIAQAAYNVGILYESNLTNQTDINEALSWYKKARDMGNTEAGTAYNRLFAVLSKNLDDEALGQGDRTEAEEIAPTRPIQAKTVMPPVKDNVYSAIVAEAQAKLFRAGYLPNRASGFMNRETEDAIRAYQRKSGLTVNGKIDKKLIQHMDKNLKAE